MKAAEIEKVLYKASTSNLLELYKADVISKAELRELMGLETNTQTVQKTTGLQILLESTLNGALLEKLAQQGMTVDFAEVGSLIRDGLNLRETNAQTVQNEG